MILVIENNPELRKKVQLAIFTKFALNTCGCDENGVEEAFARYRIAAAYIPYAETLTDLIGFCRLFKSTHTEIPLVAAVPKDGGGIDLDVLYTVTDNIPLRPIYTVRVVEIICELIRLYTGQNRLHIQHNGLELNVYHFSICYCYRTTKVCVDAISILYYLCTQFPRPVHASELAISTCNPCKEGRSKECMRTHVCTINKRAVEAFGKPLIKHVRGQGYTIAL